jgi:hypothetical protein
MVSDWMKTKTDVMIYLINSGFKYVDEGKEYWIKDKKTVVILQDKSKAKRGWTFGYI